MTRSTISGEIVPLHGDLYGYDLQHMRRPPTAEELDAIESLPQVDRVELGDWPDPRKPTG
ncbi:hypothetical protein KKI23_02960 [Patescibacteria group bacterium]|nr:hypothetical protein [Patescibacteria group bacterium]